MSLTDTLSQFLEAADAAEAAKGAKVASAADSPVPRKGNQKPAGTKLSPEEIEVSVVQTLATKGWDMPKTVEYLTRRYESNGHDVPAKYADFVKDATEAKLQALVAQAKEAFQANKASRALAKATRKAATPAAAAAAAATPAAAAAATPVAAAATRVGTKQKHDKKQEQRGPRKDATGSQKPYSKGNTDNKFHVELREHAGNAEVKQLVSDIKSLKEQLQVKQAALAALVKKLDAQAKAAAAAAAAAATAAPASAPAPVPASRFIATPADVISEISLDILVKKVSKKMQEQGVEEAFDVLSEQQKTALTKEQKLALAALEGTVAARH
jgi:hypothetical protein